MSACARYCGSMVSITTATNKYKFYRQGLFLNVRDSAGVNPGGTCPTGTGWKKVKESYLSLPDASTKQCPAGTYGGVESVGGDDTSCPDGEEYSEAGEQCAPRCADGYTELHTENGLSFKAWATQTTEHAIVLQRVGADVQCYVNLVKGEVAADNAINVMIGDDIYHTSD